MPDGPPAVDPDQLYTVTLRGLEWMSVCATMMSAGERLMTLGLGEMADEVLDIPVAIIKQIDPDGWDATEATSG